MAQQYSTHFLNCDEIATNYFSNGFVVIKDIFSEEDIRDCEDQLIQICAAITGQKNDNLENSLCALFKKSTNSYLETLRLFSKSASVQSLFLKKQMMNVLALLSVKLPTQSTQPVSHSSSSKLLIEGDFVGIKAHQDWPSIQGSMDSVVVWIPFTKIDSKSYPIQILPGSHLQGLRQSTITKNASEIQLSDFEEKCLVDVICDPGDAVIFSTFTVHRTKQIINSDKFRFSVSTRFDNALEKSFIERDYPCAYKRIVEREIQKPLSQSQIKQFFKDLQK